jgi:hypothetical protein
MFVDPSDPDVLKNELIKMDVEMRKMEDSLEEARAHINSLNDEIKHLEERLDDAYSENDKLSAIIKKAIKVLEQ